MKQSSHCTPIRHFLYVNVICTSTKYILSSFQAYQSLTPNQNNAKPMARLNYQHDSRFGTYNKGCITINARYNEFSVDTKSPVLYYFLLNILFYAEIHHIMKFSVLQTSFHAGFNYFPKPSKSRNLSLGPTQVMLLWWTSMTR